MGSKYLQKLFTRGRRSARSFLSFITRSKGRERGQQLHIFPFSLHALTHFTLVANGEEKEKQNKTPLFILTMEGYNNKKKNRTKLLGRKEACCIV